MKKILGLDLGTTSIGWAYVQEATQENEISTIENLGVRIVPMSSDEKNDFEKGNPITTNASRTLKRTARRNLQRYKQRRDELIRILINYQFIQDKTQLIEQGKGTTYQTLSLRAKAATEKIELTELARVLLAINKKRGYKSSRKAKSEEDGMAIDGMAIAKKLYDENLTPGQLVYHLLKNGKKYTPEFYRSDLKTEFDAIWKFQQQFYPEILTKELYQAIDGKTKTATSKTILAMKQVYLAEIKGKRDEQKLQRYKWRSEAPSLQLPINEIAFVLCDINGEIANSSGYLGAISDRSKQLIFNKETVGQNLYNQILANHHTSLKNQVFYRQDYLDEFEQIWEAQSKFHKELTPELKIALRDVVIFYQRRLKSQKGLISLCEFEQWKTKVNGKEKIVGQRVVPKSSPLFQEFKVWQIINNLEFQNEKTRERKTLALEDKIFLYEELNIKGKQKNTEIVKLMGLKPKEWTLNFKEVEGNNTNHALYTAYLKMLEWEGWEIDIKKESAASIKDAVKTFFEEHNINPNLLTFDTTLQKNTFDKQDAYQLWHLLYSAEDDKTLKKSLKKYGFDEKQSNLLANIPLQGDYGNLSAKAIKKILPHLKDGNRYDIACTYAEYNHSHSETKEDLANKRYKSHLEIVKKNSLRNPIVEKILNQMVNVVNAIIDDPKMGKPDEIRIELARELKKNAKQRKDAEAGIRKATAENEKIKKLIQKDFPIKNVTRKDIIRYKLWEELKDNGYKTLYTNHYIPREEIFSKKYEIEHIIPQSRLFDDSFSNKTLALSHINKEKDNQTAFDYLEKKLSKEEFNQYEERVKRLFYKDKKTKYRKLTMKGAEIPEGFIERDIKNSQYIAKKARQMLLQICPSVVSTSGKITARLREDWGLINTMKELNWSKYHQLGLTEFSEDKNGNTLRKIKDWTKRNDHRHHAMDALTVAFTKHSYIQYLNNLNARTDKSDEKLSSSIYAIQEKEMYRNERNKLKFKQPIPNFREEAKERLESILVSFKAKNKVSTKNTNKTKIKGQKKYNKTTQLTPRGQLHKETIYGKLKQYETKEVKIGSSFDAEMIAKVTKPLYRDLLLERLKTFDFDVKKAFAGKNSLAKNPIYLDEFREKKMPEKVKIMWLKDQYTIRKDIGPDLKIDKVIDAKIRAILQERLKQYNGDSKKAFGNLDENPIWLNQEKGIAIKRVTIKGIENATALHTKKDHLGNEILDKNGETQAVDFVSLGNNHHIAIYRDEKGKLQEEVVSFFKAVERVNQGLPIVNKQHEKDWEFLFTMKQNEMFVFPSEDFAPSEIDLLNPANAHIISPHLFRVQKITTGDYFFRHHLETTVENVKELKDVTYKRIGKNGLSNVIKVRINHIGQIVQIGEYE